MDCKIRTARQGSFIRDENDEAHALELHGRDIYTREGCYNCHSQMIGPFRDEVARYGEYSKTGKFAYHHPFQCGSSALVLTWLEKAFSTRMLVGTAPAMVARPLLGGLV
ncbi:MAG: hypothetical protein ACJAV7_000342 [Flavobacteriales bacterium]|jgi:hypothetical protein